MTREESNKFKWLNFMMTCAIVLYHASGGSPDFYDSRFDENIYWAVSHFSEVLRPLAMGYFFMATGYFMYRNITADNVKGKVFKRIYSLLVPFWVWDAIYFLFYFVKGYDIGDSSIVEEIIERGIFTPFAGALWYLMSIFMLCLTAPFVVKILKHKKVCMILYLLICIYSFCVNVIAPEIFILHGIRHEAYFVRILEYMPNYFFGALYAYYFPKFNIKNRKVVKILGALFIILLFGRIAVEGTNNNILIFVLDRVLPILMFLTIPYKDNQLFKKRCPDIFKASFIIYAGHEVIITYIHYTVVERLMPYLRGWSLLMLRFATVFVVLILCYLAWKILDKHFTKLLSLLTGGR